MALRDNKGFSLIELMVVIAIIAILAATAVPAYTAYKARSIFTDVLLILQQQAQAAAAVYERTGTWPSPLNFAGVDIYPYANGSNGYGNLDPGVAGNIYGAVSVYYVTNTTNGSDPASGTGMAFRVTVNGLEALNIPGYNPSNNGNGNGPNHISYGILDNNGVITAVCGGMNGDAQDIPLQYLPSECSCNSVYDYITTGSCS